MSSVSYDAIAKFDLRKMLDVGLSIIEKAIVLIKTELHSSSLSFKAYKIYFNKKKLLSMCMRVMSMKVTLKEKCLVNN